MDTPGQNPMPDLLERPLTMRMLLDTFEGVAETCEELARTNPEDSSVKQQLELSRNLYRNRVGIEVEQRQEVRRRVDERIVELRSAEKPKEPRGE
jgi:hypothetical protein